MTIFERRRLKDAMAEVDGAELLNADVELDEALKAMEGYREKLQVTPLEERPSVEWKHVVYGLGGWHRYYVGLETGEVWFSSRHASDEAVRLAQAVGFAIV